MGNFLSCRRGTTNRFLSNNLQASTTFSSDASEKTEHLLSSGSNHIGLLNYHSEVCHNFTVKKSKIRVLASLPKRSSLFHAIKWALDKHSFEGIFTSNTDSTLNAIKEASNLTHDLILLDVRNSRLLDFQAIARLISKESHYKHCVLIAIVKKSSLEREDAFIASILRAGFKRILVDSVSTGYWYNELLMIAQYDIIENLRYHLSDSLLSSSLNEIEESVQITDDNGRILYGNSYSETLLGYSNSELENKNFWDYHIPIDIASEHCENYNTGVNIIKQKLQEGKIWKGPLNCKRKTGDFKPLNTKIIPISTISKRCNDYVIFIKRPSELLESQHRTFKPYETESNEEDPTKNIISLNLAPTTNYESPFVRIIHILNDAKKTSGSSALSEIDKVLQILQSGKNRTALEYFSPESETERDIQADAVTSDLLGALLSQGPKPMSVLARSTSIVYKQSIKVRSASLKGRYSSHEAHKRNSHDGKSVITNIGHRASVPAIDNSPIATRKLLEKSHLWEFNILELEMLTDKKCLVWLGMTIFLRFEIQKTLNCSESTLQNWLTLIEANYNSENSYHNSTHAGDVLHASSVFLDSPLIKEYCDGVDEAICLIAAVIHDVDHPGRNSAFLCNSRNELANLYNDITVLENHHAALGFQLTSSDDRVNILKNLDRDSYKLIRQGVIDLVLATDMSKHFVHVNKFASIFSKYSSTSSESERLLDKVNIPNTLENGAVLKRMLIKCADVSNPARPLSICKKWAYRIANEYFTQTDDEKRLGLPVVMPQFDRATCSIPKSQIGFYDFFIKDMFELWNTFADLPQLSDIIKSNYVYWKKASSEEDKVNKETTAVL